MALAGRNLMNTLRRLPVVLLLLGVVWATTNPVPIINQPLVPMTVKPGSDAFVLTINGGPFAPDSVVSWNGSTRITSFLSPTQLQAEINAEDVATPGTAFINVVNPKPGGGTSNAVMFPVQIPAPSVALAQSSSFSGSGINAVGDFNSDGIPDLAVGGQNSGGFFIDTYYGKGNGTFSAPILTHNVTPASSMIIGYFGTDGNVYLAVQDNLGNTSTFLVLSNGVFFPQQVFRTPIGQMVSGDFNGDGKLDLVVAGAVIKIFLGKGNGAFDAGSVINVRATGLPAVGDFNGDGKLDLAFPFYSSVSVLLGNGDGTFQSPVVYQVSYSGNAAIAADVNGDGKLDIVTSGISVLLGNGDGTFTNAGGVNLSNGDGAPLYAGDFNGDGKLDVAVPAQGSVYLVLGNGDGTFQSPTQVIGDGVAQPVVADFNEDGKLDLAGMSLYLQVPLSLSPAALNFGRQNVGTKSKPQTATALNVSVPTLTIEGVTIGGTNPKDFSQTNNCGGTLSLGANCQIAVVFEPKVRGQRSASLKVNYQGLGNPQVVSLAGVGAISTVTLKPPAMKFKTELVGTTSPPQTATLTNTGTVPVKISSISSANPFAETNNCPSSLPVGAACQIQVKFAPTDKGASSGKLSVNDDAEGSPQNVKLAGTGTIVELSPLAINFGNQAVGTKSSPAPVQLTNVGKTSLAIHQIFFGGKDSGDFAQLNDCGTSVPPGGHCTIKVTFTPQSKGKRSASLQISDNGGGSPQKVALTGNGT
jgi:hypothetical protein